MQIIVRYSGLTIASASSPAGGAISPVGASIGAAIVHGIASSRLNALSDVTADVGFAPEYGRQLALAVKNVGWLRAARFVQSPVDVTPGHDGTSDTDSVLRVEARQELSPDSAVLAIRSVVDFLPSAESPAPAARLRITYRSEPIGDVADGDAIARWADQQGRAYRAELTEAIAESIKLVRLATEFMGHGPSGGGPPQDIWVCLTWGRPGFGRKMNSVKLSGDVVEESDKRLVLRGAGEFYSLPKSAIERRSVRGN